MNSESRFGPSLEESTTLDIPRQPVANTMQPVETTRTEYLLSEEMSYLQLYIPADICAATVSRLGEVGLIEFCDMNTLSAFELPFVGELRRVGGIAENIKFFIEECSRCDIQLTPPVSNLPHYYAHKRRHIDEIEATLRESRARMGQMNTSLFSFTKIFRQMTELRIVLCQVSQFFALQLTMRKSTVFGSEDLMADVEAPDSPSIGATPLTFVAGLVPREKLVAFEKILYRVLRGNLYLQTFDVENAIEDPKSGEMVFKSVFLIFVSGVHVLERVTKAVAVFGATIYPVSATTEQRQAELVDVNTRMSDLQTVLDKTVSTKTADLRNMTKMLADWNLLILKEKALYQTMNKFYTDANRKTMIAEGWCATLQLNNIRTALKEAKEAARGMVPSILNTVPTSKLPPTLIKQNRFTFAVQAIVDSYGIPNYGEINPGLFSVVSFPFLFAVMFGDFGHGFLMAIVGIYLCCKGHELDLVKNKVDYAMMLYSGRYLIVTMGVFSIYVGLLYNDAFGLFTSLFGSSRNGTDTGTYPFGIDPVWGIADNKLKFINNYKMKLAVLLGVLQMTFGSVLSLLNS